MRLLHKAYAKFMGYFWLPCPVCGTEFGGHEVPPTTPLVSDDGSAHVVCSHACGDKAKELNRANGRSFASGWTMRVKEEMYLEGKAEGNAES